MRTSCITAVPTGQDTRCWHPPIIMLAPPEPPRTMWVSHENPLCASPKGESAFPPRPASTPVNVPVEFSFTARGAYADPFNQVTLDALVTDPAGGRAPRAGLLGRRQDVEGPLRLAAHRHAHLPHRVQPLRRRRTPRRQRRSHHHALSRQKPALRPRPGAGRGEQASLRIRRRHAVLLARRHVVDGALQPAQVAAGLQAPHRRPREKGL
jgi:hypothetical protein